MTVADPDTLAATARLESPRGRRSWAAAHLLIASVGGLLLAYTGYRAHALSFTHDESLSYLFHVSRSYGSILLDADTANNHLLNTLLMKLVGSSLGPHPLWLRLPNLAAHVVYLVFSCLWLRLFARPGVLVAGFLVLNLNPYLLDFFSLARGYGLAIGLMMASVYFTTRSLRSGDARNLRMEAASLVTAALAVLASYTLLNVYLALLVVSNVAAVGRYRASRSDEPIAAFLFRRNLPAGIVSALLAALLFSPLIQLAAGGQLYYGGAQGFWRDTLASLIDRTLYQTSPAGEAGVGARLDLGVGGKTDDRHGEPLLDSFEVIGLHDGRFRETQPRHGGIVDFDQGPTAVVRCARGLTVMLTTRRMAPFSLRQISDHGLDPRDFRVLVAKGVHSPVAAYAPVCRHLIRVDTPGVTTADVRRLDYVHRRKPMFPFEDPAR